MTSISDCLQSATDCKQSTFILALNDDCLRRIVSYLDDPSSFCSVAGTCRRFLQVTKSMRNVLHSNHLWSKAEYYIKCYVVLAGYDKYCKLRNLLCDSARLTAAKGILTYAKVINIWEKNGPVAAKLFTWIRNRETNRIEGGDSECYVTEHQSVTTLHLPSCDKSMVIDTKLTRYIYPPWIFEHEMISIDDDESIHVTCGDLDITSEDEDKLPEKHKLSFKDTVRNEKPTLGSVQSAIHLLHQNLQAETKIENLVSGSKNDDEQETNYSKIMVETIHLLAQRSETKLLERLQRGATTFYETALHYELRLLPNQLLLDLILRTSSEAGNYSPGGSIVDCNFVESSISFRCLGSKIVKLWGGLHGDVVHGYPTSWHRLQLKFTLPDGKELKLDTCPGYFDLDYRKRPLPTEQLNPVTELLQECTNQSMQGEKHIPRIDNLFTTTYFLHALGFSRAEKTFLGRHRKRELLYTDGVR